MLAKLRSYRPSHAVVVAYLALFVALGGSSYAALTVTGKNVKNSSLTGKDVKNNSLTGSDVKSIRSGDVTNGALLAQDFKAGQLPTGAKGDKGDKGDRGARGDRGPSDAWAAQFVSGTGAVSGLGDGNYVAQANVTWNNATASSKDETCSSVIGVTGAGSITNTKIGLASETVGANSRGSGSNVLSFTLSGTGGSGGSASVMCGADAGNSGVLAVTQVGTFRESTLRGSSSRSSRRITIRRFHGG